MTVKTENEIWASVRTVLNAGLTAQSITGWTVRQGNQPTIQGLRDGSIYITRVASRRYGWQAHRNKWNTVSAKMDHKEVYQEEIMFQVSAFKKRDLTDLTVKTSSDIINALITFLQSLDGVASARTNGFQIARITDVREQAINTDSELYEKMPQFDLTIFIEQIDDGQVGATNTINSATLKGI